MHSWVGRRGPGGREGYGGRIFADVILPFPSHNLLCLAPRTLDPSKLVLHPTTCPETVLTILEQKGRGLRDGRKWLLEE